MMAAMYEVTGRRRRDRVRLKKLLADEKTAARYSKSLYLTPASCEAALTEKRDGLLKGGVRQDHAEAVVLAKPGETGLCLFEGDGRHLAVVPPFPITADYEAEAFEPGPLIDLLSKDRKVLVVLARLGRYSVGMLNGDRVILSKSGTRHVKNRHRKGGSSQRRFERSRERLMREYFDKVCVEARRLIEGQPGQGKNIEYVLYGGEAGTIRGLRERCDFVEKLRTPTLARLLAVDRPGHKAMQTMGAEVYSSATLELKRTAE
jgi:hypothetical protein